MFHLTRSHARAPPTPPLPRAATDNAGAYPRRPHHLPVLDDRRAASELHPQTRRTPSAGGHGIMTGIGRSGGTLSPGRLTLLWWPPKAECARGPVRKTPRPQEQDRRACGTERVISPAPLHTLFLPGRCGVGPARRGRRRRPGGSGAGEGLPLRQLMHERVSLEPGTSRPDAIVRNRSRPDRSPKG